MIHLMPYALGLPAAGILASLAGLAVTRRRARPPIARPIARTIDWSKK